MTSSKPIMIFQIFADDSQVSNLECPYGAVTMIPFTGKVESDLFTGEILPGACDVQIENPALSRNMCAKYMFEGKGLCRKSLQALCGEITATWLR